MIVTFGLCLAFGKAILIMISTSVSCLLPEGKKKKIVQEHVGFKRQGTYSLTLEEGTKSVCIGPGNVLADLMNQVDLYDSPILNTKAELKSLPHQYSVTLPLMKANRTKYSQIIK